MKRFLLLGSFLMSAALAACGGGGSSPVSVPTLAPTIKPVSYTSKLVFTGALAGRAIQSDLRQAQSVAMDAAATPLPIMVISPIAADDTIDGSDATAWGGVVQAVVSPMPSASPSTTFSNTNPDAALGTPVPGTPQPLPSGVIAQTTVFTSGTQNAQASGTASAAIGAPVNQTPTTAVYAYRAISIRCKSPMPSGSASAWKFDGTQFVPTTDQTQADVYLTGPGCDTPSSESGPTLHFPGGAVTASTDTAFCNITASLVATNPAVTLDMNAMNMKNADGSFNIEIIAKTADGTHTFKMFPGSFGAVDADYSGAIEVSGLGVDGF